MRGREAALRLVALDPPQAGWPSGLTRSTYAVGAWQGRVVALPALGLACPFCFALRTLARVGTRGDDQARLLREGDGLDARLRRALCAEVLEELAARPPEPGEVLWASTGEVVRAPAARAPRLPGHT